MSDFTKALEGKMPQGNVSGQSLHQNVVASHIDSLGFTAGDVRFIGDVGNHTLYGIDGTPDDHPRSARDLVQEQLVYGLDVYAEGISGEVLGATLNTHGVNVDFLLGPPYSLTVGDFYLIISNIATGANSPLRPLTYAVSALSGDIITVTADYHLGNLNTANGVYWQLVRANPVELLPYTEDEVGKETTYFTIPPKEWPTARLKSPSQGMTVTSLTPTIEGARIDAVFSHAFPSPLLAVGDFVVQSAASDILTNKHDKVFLVSAATSFSGAGPYSEEVRLTPFYGTDISVLDTAINFYALQKVGDITPDGSQRSGHPLSNLPNHSNNISGSSKATLRVAPLVGPRDTQQNYPAGNVLITDNTVPVGHAFTLFPAKGDGSCDLQKPLLTLEGVDFADTLENQSIRVDYDSGAVILSHAIMAGKALNPSSYTDPQGRARLFAIFVAYNDSSAPTASKELVSREGSNLNARGANAARIRPSLSSTSTEAAPQDKQPGWVMEFPSGDPNALYTRNPVEGTGNSTGTISFTYDTETPNYGEGSKALFQRRHPRSGMHRMGTLKYGTSVSPNSAFSFMPYAQSGNVVGQTPNFKEDELPEFRVTYTPLTFTTATAGTWPTVTLGVNDEVSLIVNDVPVTFIITPGPTTTTLVAELVAAIDAASIAAGVPTTDYTVTESTDFVATDRTLTITAKGNLHLTPTNVILGGGTRTPSGITLGFAYDGEQFDALSWDYNTSILTYDGPDVQLTSGASLQTVHEKTTLFDSLYLAASSGFLREGESFTVKDSGRPLSAELEWSSTSNMRFVKGNGAYTVMLFEDKDAQILSSTGVVTVAGATVGVSVGLACGDSYWAVIDGTGGNIKAYTYAGALAWSYAHGDAVYAIATDTGRVYISGASATNGDGTGTHRALNISTGTEIWTQAHGNLNVALYATGDTLLIGGTLEGSVYATEISRAGAYVRDIVIPSPMAGDSLYTDGVNCYAMTSTGLYVFPYSTMDYDISPAILSLGTLEVDDTFIYVREASALSDVKVLSKTDPYATKFNILYHHTGLRDINSMYSDGRRLHVAYNLLAGEAMTVYKTTANNKRFTLKSPTEGEFLPTGSLLAPETIQY